MSRCARCNKFMFLSSKSGFCKDCQVLNAMETAEQERKVREEAERKFQEEEAKRYAEDAQRQKAEEARKAEEKRRRLAEEAQIAEEERRRQAADARKAEEERKLKAAEERKAEEERHHKVAEARKAEEKRKHEVEEIIKANEERKREETKNNASPKAFTHSLEIGDTIKFGKYIQGVQSSDPEDVEWLVLKKSKKNILVVSKYILDYQQFPEGPMYTIQPVTWSQSHIREYLNSVFLFKAFTAEQRNAIVEKSISTDNPSGIDMSKDRIFLLSLDEAQSDRNTINPILLETEQTVYAQHCAGVFAADNWWLRSDYPIVDFEHSEGNFACYINSRGEILSGMKATHLKNGVRPAMWLNTDKLTPLLANTKKVEGEYTVGSIVPFGTYCQDGETTTALEWLVLANDGEKALLLTKTALDAKPYHGRNESVTWAVSDIRKWLNEEFLNHFSEEEQAKILQVQLENEDNEQFHIPGGKSTSDKVFFLSADEIERYLPHKFQRYGKALPSYAKENPDFVITEDSLGGCYTRPMIGNCNYWLRSPGSQAKYASIIDYLGEISLMGMVNHELPIRPALYIRIGEADGTVSTQVKSNKSTVTIDEKTLLEKSRTVVEKYSKKQLTGNEVLRLVQAGEVSINTVWEIRTQRVTLLSAAINNKDHELATYLIENGSDVSAETFELVGNQNMKISKRPLFDALGSKQFEIAELLMSHGADINAFIQIDHIKTHYIAFAAGQADSETLDWMLKHGADPNDENDTYGGYRSVPLNNAIINKNYENAKLLLRAGANPDYIIKTASADFTVLNWAVFKNDITAFNILMDAHADPNCLRVSHQGGGTNPALVDAIAEGQTIMAKRLIQAGADVNKPMYINGRSLSPLEVAMLNSDFEMMSFLRSHGARQ